MRLAIIPGEGRTGNRIQLESVHTTLELARKKLGTGHGRIIKVGDDAQKGDVEYDDWLQGAGKNRVQVSQ